MAEPLKNMYNPAFFEKLCPVMCATISDFDCKDFIFRVFNNRWPDLELKQRVRHIALVLHHFMPKHFPDAAKIIISLSKEMKKHIPEQAFPAIFLPDYIEVFGVDHPEESLDAIAEVTQLVSAEFAIRPFIVRYRSMTMERMLAWSKHESQHVRRLASEGCRPRLPWAMALPEFKKDPSEILPILENLKADESEYVRRSVANNLNDIAKDHPKIVLEIAKKWQGKNVNTNSIVRHACRTLLKKGNDHELRLHGFKKTSKAKVTALKISGSKVKIGDYLHFGFDFINAERKKENFRLEYAIDYVTSTGKNSRKIFRITENKYEPDTKVRINRKQHFKNLTTRKHFRGQHQLSILVNGIAVASTKFLVS